jgi:hypothetical protein
VPIMLVRMLMRSGAAKEKQKKNRCKGGCNQ